MEKIFVDHPDRADKSFTTGAYSPAVILDGWVYVSGQGPIDFKTGKFILGTIEEETALTMHNVKRILEAAGCTLDDVAKCTVHLSNIKDFDKYNEVYAAYFSGVKPARTTVQSVLGHSIKVEIDAVAKTRNK
jgi:2-iminobutanoate/2-iminopropanoate deaminase